MKSDISKWRAERRAAYREMCQRPIESRRHSRVRPPKDERKRAFEMMRRAVNSERDAWKSRPNRHARRHKSDYIDSEGRFTGPRFMAAIPYVQNGPKPGSKGPNFHRDDDMVHCEEEVSDG